MTYTPKCKKCGSTDLEKMYENTRHIRDIGRKCCDCGETFCT